MLTIELTRKEESIYTFIPTWEWATSELKVSRSTLYRWMEQALGLHPPFPGPSVELLTQLREVQFWCSHKKKFRSSFYTPHQFFYARLAGQLSDLLDQLKDGIDISGQQECSLTDLADHLQVSRRTVQRYMATALGMQAPYVYSLNLLPELQDIKFWNSCRELLLDASYNSKTYYLAKKRGTLQSQLSKAREEVLRLNLK